MEDVAELAGVSRALVSLVMRDAPNVSEKRRAAVREAADELGYRPNLMARNLASRQTTTLGVMVNDLHNPFFAETVDGIQAAADEAGYQIFLTTGGQSRSGERGAIETLLRFRVDGMLLVGAQLAMKHITAAAKVTPTVLIARPVRSKLLDTVNNDDRIGARLAMEHLFELGHQNIAHIDGGRGAGATMRLAGYKSEMTDAGFEKHIAIASGDYTESGGANAASKLLKGTNQPTAIFAANDLMAVGALDRIEDHGHSIPGDVSLVGYDNTALAAINHISLTTINQPRVEMGRSGVRLLLERLNDGRTTAVHHVLAPTLCVRSTTAPPNRG